MRVAPPRTRFRAAPFSGQRPELALVLASLFGSEDSVNQQTHDNTKIAFIQARWHADVVDQSRLCFVDAIGQAAQVEVFDVPGAYEIPLLSKTLAKGGNYAAVVGAALVVDGGIYRHDFVANAVVGGLMQAQLETEVPMFSVVLTPHHYHDGPTHHDFFIDHFKLKGREAAEACLAVLDLRRRLAA
jgi:6,7-dimethyl-8-ribityllumazine synthase